MYKKVLYNNKKMKKCGGGQYLNLKHSLCNMYLKKRKEKVKKIKKKLTEPGFKPTTSGLEIHYVKHYYI